jgi:hypothetical protein
MMFGLEMLAAIPLSTVRKYSHCNASSGFNPALTKVFIFLTLRSQNINYRDSFLTLRSQNN